MRAREGDMIETAEGAIFDVKGLVHPSDKVVAFIRYFPEKEGTRTREGIAYKKVYSLPKRYELLREKFPKYMVYDPVFDETLCEVKISDVKRYYKPPDRLGELRTSESTDVLEKKSLQLATLLKEESGIRWKAIGISGSVLAKLHTSQSDIDIIVYGSANCRKVHQTLESLMKNGHASLKPYNEAELKKLFDFRSKDTAMGFQDFVRTESKKVFQGKFLKIDYFLRFVKAWNEVDEKYGDVQYKNMGQAGIEATVIDDSEAILTPCSYRIEDTVFLEGPEFEPVTEVASFRGRFCEQAKVGERIVARGKIEHVQDRRDSSEHYRLLVGNNYEDFLVTQVNGLFLSK